MSYHIVVCAGIVPDPLQTLEPVTTAAGPALKNEMMLPAVFRTSASHALYEAAPLAATLRGATCGSVSAAPKAKLQRVIMNVAQKASFELIQVDAPASRFADARAVAGMLAEAIQSIPGLDRSRMLLFGGWESASRGAGVTMQLVGEQLGIIDQFQGVDQLTIQPDGSFEILERIEGGRHLVSICQGPPAVLGWATGDSQSQRTIRRSAWSTCAASCLRCRRPGWNAAARCLSYLSVTPPRQQRQTQIVKDRPADEIAAELLQSILQE